MIILDIEQGTPEWYAARLGIPTASNFDRIITTTEARSQQRKKYMYELAGERITGEPKGGYTNAAMERGHEREEESRRAYEFITGATVQTVGFCYLDERKSVGCSPDGLVGDDGGFETKDTLPHIQLDRLENGWSKADHFQQVQGCLWITGRSWWDLVSYSRGLTPIIVRFERDEGFISALSDAVAEFCADLENIIKKYSA